MAIHTFAVALTLAVGAIGVVAQEPEEPRACAVIAFKNVSNRPESAYLSEAIGQSLQFRLAQDPAWKLVERRRLKELLDEAELKAAGIVTGKPIPLQGADLLVLGEYRDDEGLVTVSARLVETRTGRILRQAEWKGHVSGISDEMPARVIPVLSGRPVPGEDLAPELQKLFDKASRDLARGEFDRAIKACTTIIEARPRHIPTLLLRGHAELGKKGWSRYAVKDFERALELDEELVAAKIGLACVMLSGDERSAAKALRWLDEVLGEYADHGEALWLSALAHESLDKPDRAGEFARRATLALPEFAPAWQTLARIELRLGHASVAIDSAQKAAVFSPKDAAVWMLMGDAQLAAGDRTAARQSFLKAMECDPPPATKTQLKARLQQFE